MAGFCDMGTSSYDNPNMVSVGTQIGQSEVEWRYPEYVEGRDPFIEVQEPDYRAPPGRGTQTRGQNLVPTREKFTQFNILDAAGLLVRSYHPVLVSERQVRRRNEEQYELRRLRREMLQVRGFTGTCYTVDLSEAQRAADARSALYLSAERKKIAISTCTEIARGNNVIPLVAGSSTSSTAVVTNPLLLPLPCPGTWVPEEVESSTSNWDMRRRSPPGSPPSSIGSPRSSVDEYIPGPTKFPRLDDDFEDDMCHHIDQIDVDDEELEDGVIFDGGYLDEMEEVFRLEGLGDIDIDAWLEESIAALDEQAQ